MNTPLLSVRELVKTFPAAQGWRTQPRRANFSALSKVSFDIYPGETLGLVGESGSGKSTLGKCLLRLIEPDAGEISFRGQNLRALMPSEMRSVRKRMQIVFQDPYSALNPRMTVEELLLEPLEIHQLYQSEKDSGYRSCRLLGWPISSFLGHMGGHPSRNSKRMDRIGRIGKLLDLCGLAQSARPKFPREFSGGQRQRICIARALAVEPEFIVCDEPLSSLDVATQVQILELLQRLQRELNLTYLFISHDLRVVAHLSSRVAVMFRGEIVDVAPAEVFRRDDQRDRLHTYSQQLLAAVPKFKRN